MPRTGRTSTGAAKTSTQRNRERRARLSTSGMRALHCLITREAGQALDALTADGTTQSQAVSAALIVAAIRD